MGLRRPRGENECRDPSWESRLVALPRRLPRWRDGRAGWCPRRSVDRPPPRRGGSPTPVRARSLFPRGGGTRAGASRRGREAALPWYGLALDPGLRALTRRAGDPALERRSPCSYMIDLPHAATTVFGAPE